MNGYDSFPITIILLLFASLFPKSFLFFLSSSWNVKLLPRFSDTIVLAKKVIE